MDTLQESPGPLQQGPGPFKQGSQTLQEKADFIQQFGRAAAPPPPAELKTYHRYENVALTAILSGDVKKRVKVFMPGSEGLSEVGELIRNRATTEEEGWGREDVKSIIWERPNLEEQDRDEFSRSTRRSKHQSHPTLWYTTRGKLRKNLSSGEGGSTEGDSKTMRKLVEELHILKQEKQARQLEHLEALKQRHAKALDHKGQERDDNAAYEDEHAAGKDGEKEGTTISLSQAQEMNTVYMEGDNSTQGYHFRL